MEARSNKLQAKDLINVGIFTAIYFVIFFAGMMLGYPRKIQRSDPLDWILSVFDFQLVQLPDILFFFPAGIYCCELEHSLKISNFSCLGYVLFAGGSSAPIIQWDVFLEHPCPELFDPGFRSLIPQAGFCCCTFFQEPAHLIVELFVALHSSDAYLRTAVSDESFNLFL